MSAPLNKHAEAAADAAGQQNRGQQPDDQVGSDRGKVLEGDSLRNPLEDADIFSSLFSKWGGDDAAEVRLNTQPSCRCHGAAAAVQKPRFICPEHCHVDHVVEEVEPCGAQKTTVLLNIWQLGLHACQHSTDGFDSFLLFMQRAGSSCRQPGRVSVYGQCRNTSSRGCRPCQPAAASNSAEASAQPGLPSRRLHSAACGPRQWTAATLH